MEKKKEDGGMEEEVRRHKNPKEDGENVDRERSETDKRSGRKRGGTKMGGVDHGNGEEPQECADETRTGRGERPSDGVSREGPSNEEMNAQDARSGGQKTDSGQSGTDKNDDRTPKVRKRSDHQITESDREGSQRGRATLEGRQATMEASQTKEVDGNPNGEGRSGDNGSTTEKSRDEEFVEEMFGWGILDTGCNITVAGSKWFRKHCEKLTETEREGIEGPYPTDAEVIFGSGENHRAHQKYIIPVRIHDQMMMLETQILAADIPLVISMEEMRKAGVKLDLQNDKVTIHGVEKEAKYSSEDHLIVQVVPSDGKGKQRNLKRENKERRAFMMRATRGRRTREQATTEWRDGSDGEVRRERKESRDEEMGQRRRKTTKEVAEFDEEDRLRVKGNFVQWTKESDDTTEIKIRVKAYGVEKEEGEDVKEWRPSLKRTRTIIRGAEAHHRCSKMMAEKVNILKVRIRISDTPGGEYAILETEIKIPKMNEEEEHRAFTGQDGLNDSICYEIYRRLKEIAKEIGFGDATGRSDTPEDWKTVNEYTKAGQEVRWGMAGARVCRFAADKKTQHTDGQPRNEDKISQPEKRDNDERNKGLKEIEKEMTFLYIQRGNRNIHEQDSRRKVRSGRSDGGGGHSNTERRTETPEERKGPHPSGHARLKEKWIKTADAGSEEMEEIRARMRARMEAARRGDRRTLMPEQERNLPEYSSWSYKQVRQKIKKKSVGPHTFHDSEREKGRRPEQ